MPRWTIRITAVIELDDDVFGAPADGIDAAAREARREPFRERKAQIGRRCSTAAEAPAKELQRQAATNRLDFR